MAPNAPPTLPTMPASNVRICTIRPILHTAHAHTIEPSVLDLGPLDALIPVFFADTLPDTSAIGYMQMIHADDAPAQNITRKSSGSILWIRRPVDRYPQQRRSPSAAALQRRGRPIHQSVVDKALNSVVPTSSASEFQPVPELQGFELLGWDSSQVNQEMRPEGIPSLFVQVTRFACGGIVIATTFNHMTTGAKGFFNVLTAWCELSRTDDEILSTIKVDHNRALVQKSSFQEYLSKHADPLPASSAQGLKKLAEWAFEAFEVSTETVQSLKQEAEEKTTLDQLVV